MSKKRQNCLRALFMASMASLTALLFTNSLAANENAAEQLINRFELRESELASRDMPGWRAPKSVLFWGSDSDLAGLKKEFPELTFQATSSIEDAKQKLKVADVFIGFCIPGAFDKDLNISWLQSMGVGVEGCVNSPAIQNANMILTNTKRLSSPEIAEHSIALMFALVRRLDQYAASQAKQTWDRGLAPGVDQIWEIEGRTMLVVGLGGIGSETAKRAKGLGMKVIATRNSSRKGPAYVDYVGLSNELMTLASKADVIVNTVPLTDKTTGLFDRQFFKAMKPSAYFINIARGRSVVTSDLLAALEAGELAGAGLDVTDPEPLPADHPLWKQERVIITPHVAYRSEKLRQRVMTLAKENLHRYIRGDRLISIVDLDKGY
ncbi:D-2-hydroxyacid dehydrogenase [Aliikangiella marina]|uniref:D-2-hydroxyacid dehydrogenase n=1 Tax=Aliikangiella marina TaxID=1712262 RepID=A0A545TD07_9GAMM|nr:D-2-hydroxyacid dehydrogenase [Aliikangiella marina]TQV75097.1 D-2-hydroxyacid dehydrogenase [Aliikangiella marina]